MVSPGIFTGRVEELNTIEQCLFQTKHENPQHFLVEGERGIGKSSLLFVADIIAQGAIEDRDSNRMKFLTVSVDMAGVESQLDIVRAIARQLKESVGQHAVIKEKAKAFWDWLTKWEVLGVKFHNDQELNPEEIRDELVGRFAQLVSGTKGEVDGVFILIDEADAPPEEAALGEFLKLFAERLAKRGCNSVLIGLAGLPSTITKLRASHESSPRLFEVMRLDPLAPEERAEVVRRGLAVAATKNGKETKITDDALKMISDLSEGYPHFIQQFAYYAFAEDDDDVIDVADVALGAYKENGALMQLGHKYFSEMYHAKISSDDYRKVLGAMAAHSDAWVARKDIIIESGVSETNVTNALAALKERKIINADDSRRGFYRLPTKSFATWINAIRSVEAKQETESPNLFGEK